jgi:hypothetical protein
MPARYHTHLALCAGSRRVRLRCALRMPIMRRMQECAPNGMRRSGLGRNQRRLSTSKGDGQRGIRGVVCSGFPLQLRQSPLHIGCLDRTQLNS